MSLRLYLFLMTVGTAICWAVWVFVILKVDPEVAGNLGFIFFYSTLFLALVGTFSVFGFALRKMVIKNEAVIFRHVKRTFRQGVFIASTVTILLLLLQKDLLVWWNGALIIIFFLIVEGIIFTNRRYSNEDYVQKDL